MVTRWWEFIDVSQRPFRIPGHFGHSERPSTRETCGCSSGAILDDASKSVRWEHFRHGADIGIRGIGLTRAQAFEQAAMALTAVVTAPKRIRCLAGIDIRRSSPDEEFLFLDWINALIFEMSTRDMLFGRFHVVLDESALSATAWGEPVDIERHCPAVEPKGATFTQLADRQTPGGACIVQCVVDV